MVGAIKDVKKTQVHKAQSGLMPSRIEPNQARIAIEFESADRAAGREKAKNSDDAQPQAREAGVNRKRGVIRLNRIIKQHVQHGLVPEDIRGIRERRASDVGKGLVVRGEGTVRWERDARGDDFGIGQANIALVDFDKVGDPQGSRAGKQAGSAREIEIAGAAFGEVDVAHGLQRHANQEMKMGARRLDKHLNGYIVGNVMSRRARRQQEKQRGKEHTMKAKHRSSPYLGTYPDGKIL